MLNENNLEVHFVKDVRDKEINGETSFTLSFPELIEYFNAEPEILENKEQGMLFCISAFNGTKAEAKNFSGTYGLILDYDGGETIDWAKEYWSGIRHFGYTSFSHLKDGATHKFRVVIPFKTFCPVTEWDGRKKNILQIAGNIDHSTIAKARLFFMPAISQDRTEHYQFWEHDGELLDWEQFDKIEYEPIEPVKIIGPTKIGGKGRVIFETFDIVSFFKDRGLYLRNSGGGKHNVICPNSHCHSGKAVEGTVIYEGNGGNFYCSHAHCQNFNINEYFTTTLGKGWKRPYCECEDLSEATPDQRQQAAQAEAKQLKVQIARLQKVKSYK